MTRKEKAKFARLEKRRYELYVALCIIHTWLAIGKDTEELLYRISKFCTEKIEADKYAGKREEVRNDS